MKPSEATAILSKIAAYDRRTVGEADAIAWAEALDGQVTIQDAMTAVRDHFRESNDWLMPKHVIDRARKIRVERIRAAGLPDYPAGLSQSDERKWLRQFHFGLDRHGDAAQAQGAADRALNVTRVDSTPMDADAVRRIIENYARTREIEGGAA